MRRLRRAARADPVVTFRTSVPGVRPASPAGDEPREGDAGRGSPRSKATSRWRPGSARCSARTRSSDWTEVRFEASAACGTLRPCLPGDRRFGQPSGCSRSAYAVGARAACARGKPLHDDQLEHNHASIATSGRAACWPRKARPPLPPGRRRTDDDQPDRHEPLQPGRRERLPSSTSAPAGCWRPSRRRAWCPEAGRARDLPRRHQPLRAQRNDCRPVRRRRRWPARSEGPRDRSCGQHPARRGREPGREERLRRQHGQQQRLAVRHRRERRADAEDPPTVATGATPVWISISPDGKSVYTPSWRRRHHRFAVRRRARADSSPRSRPRP